MVIEAAINHARRKPVVFLYEELFYLFRCEQHPLPTLYKEEDACTLHFAGQGTDTTHGMVCV